MMRRTGVNECESMRIDAKPVRKQCEISAKMIRDQCEIDPKRCESMRIVAIDVKRIQIDGSAKLHSRKTAVWHFPGARCVIIFPSTTHFVVRDSFKDQNITAGLIFREVLWGDYLTTWVVRLQSLQELLGSAGSLVGLDQTVYTALR